MQPSIMQWAIRHKVSALALQELSIIFGLTGEQFLPAHVEGISESAVQSAVRLEAARKGVKLFRNNVGVLMNDRNQPVRYGLGNDSKRVNDAVKSGDLIGFRTVRITPLMVGQNIAQFVSRECKAVGWRYTGRDREPAQLAWAQLVAVGGGDAMFCTGEGSLDEAVTISHNALPSI